MSRLTISLLDHGLHWTIYLQNGHDDPISSAGSMTLKDPADPWFAYIQEPSRLWFFNGSDELFYSITEDVIKRGHTVVKEGKLLPGSPTPPAEVIRRLPVELQKLFPAAGEAARRPSI